MSLAEKLFEASSYGVVLERKKSYNLSLIEAYAIQRDVVNLKQNQLVDPLKGYKISLTSKETQELFGARFPLYGALTENSFVENELDLNMLNEPLIEIELIFIVEEPISLEDDTKTIMNKVRIAPGIEVPDSRFSHWFPHLSLNEVVMDSAVAGKVIQGLSSKFQANELDSIKATLTLNGEVIAEGGSSEVLGHPVNAVKWLVEELAQSGQRLEKGFVISSGTFILPRPLERGEYEAHFEKVGTVNLSVK